MCFCLVDNTRGICVWKRVCVCVCGVWALTLGIHRRLSLNPVPSLFLEVEPLVWIVGNSIIHRLHTHTCAQRLDQDLGLHCQITWASTCDVWEQLLPALRSLRAGGSTPDVIVLHVGGSGLVREGRDRMGFRREIERTLVECFRLFPNTRFVLSDILQRRLWRGQIGPSAYGLERSRRWVNGRMRGFMAERRMRCVSNRNIGLAQLCGDGVHPNPEGLQLLMSNFREALQDELPR